MNRNQVRSSLATASRVSSQQTFQRKKSRPETVNDLIAWNNFMNEKIQTAEKVFDQIADRNFNQTCVV